MFTVAFVGSVLTLGSCGGGDSPSVTAPPVVTRIDLSTSTTTLATAQTVQLSPVARSSSGIISPAPTFTWTTSASTIATVNSSGLVTAIAPGNVTITTAVGTISNSVSFSVVAAGGTITKAELSLSDASLQIGGLGQATVTARDDSNKAIAIGTRTVNWNSSKPNVATISETGVISAIGVGTSALQVTIQENGRPIIATGTITVVPIPNAPISADVTMPGNTFSPTDIIVKLNGTVRFYFPSDQHNVFWRPPVSGAPADINSTQSVTVSRKFTTAGVFPFVCTLHNGMLGTVIVSP